MPSPQGDPLSFLQVQEPSQVKHEQDSQPPDLVAPPTSSSSSTPFLPTEVEPSAATTASQDPPLPSDTTPRIGKATDNHITPSTPLEVTKAPSPAPGHVKEDAPSHAAGEDAPKSSHLPPSTTLDLASYGDNNIEAIAAAQIAAGLGDFDFSVPTQDAADANTATSAQIEGADVIAGNAKGGPSGEGTNQAATTAASPQQPIRSPVATAAPHTANSRSTTLTPQTAAHTPSMQTSNFLFSNGIPAVGMKQAITKVAQSNVPSSQSRSSTAAPTGLSFPQSKPTVNASPSAPTGVTTKTEGASATVPLASSSSSSIIRPSPQANAHLITNRPQVPSANPRPMAPNAGLRPTPPRPGVSGAPSTGIRPPPPRPGAPFTAGRPTQPGPSMGGRPPAPALPASALFTQGPPGMPSFASLLGSLGPQDLAMVAHAAMGLDANGDPLPGNEESHRALADAMRKLRESAAARPPPHLFRPPYQQHPGQQQQPHYQNGIPLPRPPPGQPSMMYRPRPPPPKMVRPRPVRPPKQPPQDAWILARAASEGGSIDALGKTGDPLQDKLPLIAGPRPDRAPPRGGPPPEKRFQCPKCDRAFARAYNLNTHFATHDPDPNRAKPFPCPYPSCKSEFRSFSRKHDLQRHIASTHEAEPEPIIEIADAETGETIQSNLAKLGLGAPGRKFRCECGRAFVRRDALRKHSCEAMRGQSLADLEYSSHSPSSDPRGGYVRRQHDADSLARRAAGLPALAGPSSDNVDFEALAASFAADAAQEMQAAQEHAARQGGDEDDEDPDDAIANLASRWTAGAAAELGITTSADDEEEEEEEEEGEDGDDDEGISAEVEAAMKAKAAAQQSESKPPQGAMEAGGNIGTLQDTQFDDAAAKYIAELQSQIGGDHPSSPQVPGAEDLLASISGDAIPAEVGQQGNEAGPTSASAQGGLTEREQAVQQEPSTNIIQDRTMQQQQNRKHSLEDVPSAHANTQPQPAGESTSHLSKRVKREEDEEYDQLAEDADTGQQSEDTAAPSLVAETSISA